MENLQENKQEGKNPKKAKNAGKWTVLFIGNKGKIIPVTGFKGITIAAALMLLVSLSVAVYFYIFYQREREKNEILRSELSNKQEQVIALRDKRDMILARLIAAESRIADGFNGKGFNEMSGGKATGNVPYEFKSNGADLAPKEGPENPESCGYIVIKAFGIFNNPETGGWTAQFKLINNRVNFQPVSGYAFVILKPDEIDPGKWCTVPSTDLVMGKPPLIQRGYHFSVARYKTLKLESQADADLKEFVNASVVVYAETGELLIEKNFALHLS